MAAWCGLYCASLSRPCAADRVVQAIEDLGYNLNPNTIRTLGNRLDKPAADCALRSHQPLCPTHAFSSLSASRLVAASCITAAIYARLSCHSPSLSFASSHFASFPRVTACLRHAVCHLGSRPKNGLKCYSIFAGGSAPAIPVR